MAGKARLKNARLAHAIARAGLKAEAALARSVQLLRITRSLLELGHAESRRIRIFLQRRLVFTDQPQVLAEDPALDANHVPQLARIALDVEDGRETDPIDAMGAEPIS